MWRKATTEPAEYLPLLRTELVRDDANDIFLLDGSLLLSSLSQTRADRSLILGTLQRVNLGKINPAIYVGLVNQLGMEGEDTRAAAARLLDYPDKEIIVDCAVHVLFLNRAEYLVFAFFPNREDFLPDFIKALDIADDKERIASFAQVVWAVQTPESYAALKSYLEDSKHPQDAREFVKKLFSHKADVAPRNRWRIYARSVGSYLAILSGTDLTSNSTR